MPGRASQSGISTRIKTVKSELSSWWMVSDWNEVKKHVLGIEEVKEQIWRLRIRTFVHTTESYLECVLLIFSTGNETWNAPCDTRRYHVCNKLQMGDETIDRGNSQILLAVNVICCNILMRLHANLLPLTLLWKFTNEWLSKEGWTQMPLHIVNAIQRQKPFEFKSITGAPDVEGCGIRDVHVLPMVLYNPLLGIWLACICNSWVQETYTEQLHRKKSMLKWQKRWHSNSGLNVVLECQWTDRQDVIH